MTTAPRQISLAEWEARYDALRAGGLAEPAYGGPLSRRLADGDWRLEDLRFDNSVAALNLWNFLLTEESRLHDARRAGSKLVGAMKDLGTVPVLAYSLPRVVAFYPDGAWWLPCVMKLGAGLLGAADAAGIDESFCPVRAMLGAFLTRAHFPIPDLLVCSAGATCDDFSAIAQRLNGLGYPVLWWEMPHRRRAGTGETAVALPGGLEAETGQVEFVESELRRVGAALEDLAGSKLDDGRLRAGIETANEVRETLDELRRLAFEATVCPLPALELLIAEMMAVHFCSDREEALRVLRGLRDEVRRRAAAQQGFLDARAARVFWVNPVADLKVMNLLEDVGARLCGTEHLFPHALDRIPAGAPPWEALARMALSDPMVGSGRERAARICREARRFGAEGVVISRIPGASHCALEGAAIAEAVEGELGLPAVEIEVPPLADSMEPTLRTRLEALVETIRARRGKGSSLTGCPLRSAGTLPLQRRHHATLNGATGGLASPRAVEDGQTAVGTGQLSSLPDSGARPLLGG